MSKRSIDTIILDDSDDEENSSGIVYEHGDSFEADLARILALSKRESEQASGSSSSRVGSSSATPAPAPVPGASGVGTGGGSGLTESRQELERARLERQKEREASGTASAARVGPAVKRPKVATLSDVQDSSSTGMAAPLTTSSSSRVHGFSSLGGGSRSSSRFYSGAVKRVANIHVPDNDSYSFGEIINGGEELEMAIVGAFCLDPLWVCSHFKAATPLLLVMPRGKGDVEGPLAQVDASIKLNAYRVIPEMRPSGNEQYNCMHTKIIVLYFKTFVRIIIPTANAVDYDWAIIDNAFYVHDFPLRRDVDAAAADPRENPTHTQFSKQFLETMHTLGVPKRFVAPYKKWDFSNSKDIRLIASTQGTWHGWNEIKKGGGLPGLAAQVRSMGFSDGGRWEIEATGSSIGQMPSNWLAQMMGACEGLHPSKYFRKGSTTPPHLPQRPASVPTQLPIKIVFPTLDEINGSWGGQGHGGTIFCAEKTWTSNTFPKHLLHRGVSKRHRVTAHTKTIVAIHKPKSKSGETSDLKHEGFVYFGSHNFTQAAWGKLQIASRDGEPELVANNYELGVLIPIRGSSEQDLENKASELATFKRPLMKYSPSDVPWMQGMYRSS